MFFTCTLSPFRFTCVKLLLDEMFRYISNFDRTFNEQKVETLIRHRALLHLIWVQTVCLCPPPPKKKDAIYAYGLVISYDLHNYGKKNLWPDFPNNYELADDCMCSFTCLSCLCLNSGTGMSGECGDGCRW